MTSASGKNGRPQCPADLAGDVLHQMDAGIQRAIGISSVEHRCAIVDLAGVDENDVSRLRTMLAVAIVKLIRAAQQHPDDILLVKMPVVGVRNEGRVQQFEILEFRSAPEFRLFAGSIHHSR